MYNQPIRNHGLEINLIGSNLILDIVLFTFSNIFRPVFHWVDLFLLVKLQFLTFEYWFQHHIPL